MNCWLSPTGKVVNVELGGHWESALKICEEKYLTSETDNGFGEFEFINNNPLYYLEDRGWIRHCDWDRRIAAQSDGWIMRNKRPTKKQIEMMFELTGYFYNKE
jgi:hypothetical protein